MPTRPHTATFNRSSIRRPGLSLAMSEALQRRMRLSPIWYWLTTCKLGHTDIKAVDTLLTYVRSENITIILLNVLSKRK